MMGLAPDTFWSMSLPEWRAAVAGFARMRGQRAGAAADPMRRSELERLMQIYRDTDSSHG
jgi:hypothetical protein